MENNEKVMTGEESLHIITNMINKTKVNISQSSFHLLFWGWLIFACSLSEFVLWKFTSFSNPWYVWFFVVPGIFVSLIYGFIKGKKEPVFTFATKLYVWTWIGFLFASTVLFVVHSEQMESIAKYILLLAALPTFLSGHILKFRPLIYGAVIFWILSLAAHFGGPTVEALSVPVAMLTGYLIPGYILKRKFSHDAV